MGGAGGAWMWAGIDGGWGCSGCTCMCVCVCTRLEGGFYNSDGKIRFFFFMRWREGGWRAVTGFSNGTSPYFMYVQMEENENVFSIGLCHAISFSCYVSACVCLCVCVPPCLHLTPPPPPFIFYFLFLAHPQGYIMSGHLVGPSLNAEYVVPLIPKHHTIYSSPAITYSSLCPVSTAHPAVINERDLGK